MIDVCNTTLNKTETFKTAHNCTGKLISLWLNSLKSWGGLASVASMPRNKVRPCNIFKKITCDHIFFLESVRKTYKSDTWSMPTELLKPWNEYFPWLVANKIEKQPTRQKIGFLKISGGVMFCRTQYCTFRVSILHWQVAINGTSLLLLLPLSIEKIIPKIHSPKLRF